MRNVLFCLFMTSCIEYDYSIPEKHNIAAYPPTYDNTEIVDNFRQANQHPVNVLFFIDKSCSMQDNLSALSYNTTDLVRNFQENNIDYRIGVSSTDNDLRDTGKLQGFNHFLWIDQHNTVYNPSALMSYMIASLPCCGEHGFTSMLYFFHKNREQHEDFFRYDAPFYLITVSDEEEQSDPTYMQDLIEVLSIEQQKYDAPFVLNNIITLPNYYNDCEYPDPWATIGYRYLEINDKQPWSGKNINICDQDWSDVWKQLNLYATPKNKTYTLSRHPVPGTIQVYNLTPTATIELIEDIHWYFNVEKNMVILIEFEHKPEYTIQIVYTEATEYYH